MALPSTNLSLDAICVRDTNYQNNWIATEGNTNYYSDGYKQYYTDFTSSSLNTFVPNGFNSLTEIEDAFNNILLYRPNSRFFINSLDLTPWIIPLYSEVNPIIANPNIERFRSECTNSLGGVVYIYEEVGNTTLHTTQIKLNEATVLYEQQKNDWIQKAEKLAGEGLKVIGGAYKPLAHTEDALIENLAFVGLFGLIDPPRKEVFEAIQECKNAGIKVIMITGDHPATAKNIALKLGIIEDENTPAMLGKDMKDYDVLTEKEKKVWANTTVFARVSPKQKLDLVTVLQEKGNVIGMTGDGVNDAPALKKADIGIAMGLKGTQVSQEAADMVLKTDSFAAIVIAIKQGRIIFENIRKFVIFLLSCNLSELLIIATAAIFNFQFQLLALQILFINLVTDLLPALALGMIGGSDHIMKKPPRNMKEPIIDQKRWVTTFFYAIVIGASSLGAVLFSHYLAPASAKCNHEICNNILFFTLIFSQLLHVFNMGSGTSFFRSEVMRNKYVWGATAISLLTLLGAYAFEPSRKVLSMYEMNRYDWAISIGASFASLIIIQLGKKLKLVKQ